jgi:hypothetical protein
MGKNISKRRQEMGEEAWADYQRKRKNAKADDYKRRNVKKVVEWRRRTKFKLIEYKGGKCERCGYNEDCASCYDFHHIDPSTKEFRIGGKTLAFEKLKKEVDKCMLLCRNCHSWIHEQEYAKQRAETMQRLVDQ